MKRHKQLFDRIASLGNLLAASRNALRGKRATRDGAEFLLDWEYELVALNEELSTGSYRPGAHRYFDIYEPKQRRVSATRFQNFWRD